MDLLRECHMYEKAYLLSIFYKREDLQNDIQAHMSSENE
jgi:hypothetical protein